MLHVTHTSYAIKVTHKYIMSILIIANLCSVLYALCYVLCIQENKV